MPSRRDVLKTGAGLAVLSALPMVAGRAHAVAVSGPSFGTRTTLGRPASVYSDVRNGLGCLIDRNGIQWANFEATRGSYRFDNLDRMVDNCQAAGLRVLIPITGPKPDWAGGGFSAPTGAILASYLTCRFSAAGRRHSISR
jgi:hypothetical protein